MKKLNLLDKKIKCQELEILELKKEIVAYSKINKYQLDMHQDLLGQIARLKQKLKRYEI